MNRKTQPSLGAFLLLTFAPAAPAATVTWDGDATDGLWSSATNWDGNGSGVSGVPDANDTVIINNGDTVTMDLGGGFPPSFLDISLSGNSTLANGAVYRLQAGTITVGSGSTLGSGGFWDLDDGTLNFKNGAAVNIGNWEQKDVNNFNFELGSSGFTTLTPGTFRIGNGGLTADIANATYTVDMAAYTGGVGVITLADFASDAFGMDNATFQGAGGLNVINNGGYTASLQWNDTTEAIELNITGVPEPSALLLLGFAGLGLTFRRHR